MGRIIAEHGRLDVLVHNAGHMVYGPSEAFTPEQLAELYDINVLGCQRVNRAALPHMRRAGRGLLRVDRLQQRGGRRAAAARPVLRRQGGMDALAVAYARELAPLGIESSIVVPGAFTTGTNHFATRRRAGGRGARGGLRARLAEWLRRPHEGRAGGDRAG